MKKIIGLLSLLCLCFHVAHAQDSGNIDLEEAILIGLDNNFGVKIARNDQVIAEREARITRGSLLMPIIDATFLRSYTIDDVTQQFANSEQPNFIPNATSNNENYALIAGYGLRPEAIYTMKIMGKLAEVSELEAKVMVENTVAGIATAYYRLVLEIQRQKVLETTLELSQSRLDIAQARYELGGAGRRDFLTAQVDYNADKSLLVNQELAIKNARINFNELLALSPGTNLEVNDTIIVQNNLVLDDLVENAYINNKQFLIAQRNKNVAYLTLRETQASRLPFINFNASYNNSRLEAQAGILLFNQREGFNYGLTAGFNVFNGFALNRRIQNAKVQRVNAEYAVQQFEIQLASDIQRAYNIYNTNMQLLDIEFANYQVATESADIALERFRLGIADYLQFRDAQVNLLTAQDRLITALYNIKEMEIELMRLSGRIFYQNGSEQFSLNLK
ncbi:outer membrane efflux protein [Indibacter alkaliphilus LW1]|uniref:Outer membrane efflux protein n=1 Tax=Indibacter alkaliphilus (strain CCUG 57479 / KCTC 22604 / LW1) TaxID=1189612 RepID=S2DJV6_INDAL|nr:TolC family protein [Indibacter alkaliphilus]EOZ92276.1 outer membrane efflux protein [Indibacter alkaliphilus LW1]